MRDAAPGRKATNIVLNSAYIKGAGHSGSDLATQARLLSWDWFTKWGQNGVQGPSHKKMNICVFTDRERGRSGPAYIWRAGPVKIVNPGYQPQNQIKKIPQTLRFKKTVAQIHIEMGFTGHRRRR